MPAALPVMDHRAGIVVRAHTQQVFPWRAGVRTVDEWVASHG